MRRVAFVTVLLASPSAAAPFNLQFGADGRYVCFRWRQPTVDTLAQDYRVNVSGTPRLERPVTDWVHYNKRTLEL